VSFSINPGGKTRIQSINFTGNKVFTGRKLKDQLKLTQAYRWWWPWTSKNLYHPAKWEMDVGSVRDLYENNGYLDVDVRPPIVEVREIVKKSKAEAPAEVPPVPAAEPPAKPPVDETLTSEERRKRLEEDRRREEKARKKAEKERKKAEPKIRRWVDLTIQVNEGSQYRVGDVTVTGNTVFTDEQIRALVPVRKGDVVNIGLVKTAVDGITRLYANKGYYLATAVQQRERHPETMAADLAIEINEDRPYYVARIEFTGNTFTHDKVLRREMPLKEGDLFNRGLLDLGIQKANQLGYYEAKEQPIVEPIEG